MTPSDLALPRRTHPVTPMLDLLSGRGIVGLAAGALVIGRPIVAIVLVTSTLLISVAAWWRQTWSFDGSTITLDDGILQRTSRRVPVGRVQQVEVNEPFLHRLVGLAVVRIETAGGAGHAEIRVDALPRAAARHLQASVLDARTRAHAHPDQVGVPEGQPPPPPPGETVVVRLSTGRIMLGGVTSSNLLVVFAAMGAMADFVGRLPRRAASLVEDETGELVGALGFGAAVVALVGLVLVAAALSAVASHHGLTVVRRGDELRLRRGLFERRDAVVPLARIQSVAIRQNPAQRVVGVASVQIRSAGTDDRGDQRLMVTAARPADVTALLAATVGRPVSLHGLVAAPAAARARRIGRRLMVVGVLVLPWSLVPALRSIVVGMLAAGAVVAVVSGLDAYRALGYRMDGDLVVTRWGSLFRRTVVSVVGRVQSVRIRSSPFQRAKGLSTLAIDLAGRGTTPLVIDQTGVRCIELESALRVEPVSTTVTPYATLVARSHPAPNEEL